VNRSKPILGMMAMCLWAAASTAGTADVVEQLETHQKNLAMNAHEAVVHLSTPDGLHGVGFFITADGVLLTSRSSVGESNDVTVHFHDGRVFPGIVMERSTGGDRRLALVRVPESGLPFLRLTGGAQMDMGRFAYVLGRNAKGRMSLHTGVVTSQVSGDVMRLQIPADKADAGRPVLDKAGRVVGVMMPPQDSEDDAIALRIEEAPLQLKKLSTMCDCLVIHAPEGAPIYVDGEVRGQGPKLVWLVDRRPHSVYTVVGGKMRKKRVRFPDHRTVRLK